MGIGCDLIHRLIDLRLAGALHWRTSVMEIGAQQLANNFLESKEGLRWLGLLFGIDRPLELAASKPTHIVHGELEHLDQAAPAARDFWLWLGFQYAAIDVDGSPGSIPLDLNYDCAPPESRGRYGLVTNFGTTEHVANQLNAFEVIHDLTALNGVMMHQVPAQGMFNHGLVNYNLKFFWMLARSNAYEVLFADYSQSLDDYNLPNNIVDFVSKNNVKPNAHLAEYKGADAGISIVLRKAYDSPYVAPLDVPTGAETSVELLKKRYWSVFEPDAFARFQERSVSPGQ